MEPHAEPSPTDGTVTVQRRLRELEDFFENGSIGLHLVGGDGTILRANAAELAMMGYAREEYVGRHIAEFHVDADVIADLLARLTRGETIRDHPARLRAKDGSIKHVLIDSSGHFVRGKFQNTRCFTRDVTQTRLVEDSQRRSDALLRAVYDSLDSVVLVLREPDFVIASANAAAKTVFGYEPHELVGRSTRLLHPDDASFESLAAMGRAKLATDEAFRAKATLRRKNGEIFPTEHVARAMRDTSGALLGYVSVIRDISDEKRAEEMQARYVAIVESSEDAIISADREGIILSWNGGAEKLYGYTAQESLGRHVTFMMTPEAAAAFPALYARCLRGEATRIKDVERLRKGGERVTVALHLSPLLDTAGRVIGVSGIARDVTERQRAEQALAKSRDDLSRIEKLAAMGSLVSGVAHELRTPLTFLATNAFLAQRRLERLAMEGADARLAVKETAPFLGEVTAAVDRINLLVEDLRKYTKTRSADRLELDRLDDVVREGVELFRATHRSMHSVEASYEPTRAAPMRRGAIQQLVLNLLQNAIEASPGGTNVSIDVRDSPEGPEVVVADRGSGMPPELLARIYEPLFTTKPDGTGLGLTIVRRIVEEHGGTIRCESEPGRGTRFTVRLPAGDEAAE